MDYGKIEASYGDLVLSDANAGDKTLTQLAAEGVANDGTVNPENLLINGDMASWVDGTSGNPFGWTNTGSGSVAQSSDSVIGSYSAQVTGTSGYQMRQHIHTGDKDMTYWLGRTVTMGAWCKTTAAGSHLRMYTGPDITYSNAHTGGGGWEWLEVRLTVTGGSLFELACTVGGTDVALFDGAIGVEGNSAFAFAPKPYAELKQYSSSFVRLNNAASGDQVITGVGFEPKVLLFCADTSNAVGQASWGSWAANGVNQVMNDYYTTTPNTYEHSGSKSIWIQTSVGNQQQGNVSAVSSNGFTITWVKNGGASPSGGFAIRFVAFG